MSIARFLEQRAVEIQLHGTYTLPNWYNPKGRLRSFACRSTRVSAFRMLLEVPVVGRIGDHLTCYFRDFGKFDGRISDTTQGGFLLELDLTRTERVKFAKKLAWLDKKRRDPTMRDARRDARFVPISPHSALTLADGTIVPCFVIDASLSGVAVSSQVQPKVGTPLAVGSCVGRVVRLFSEGFAVKFAEPMTNLLDLKRRVITPPLWSARANVMPEGERVAVTKDYYML
jgi:hypothetical protein